MTIQRPPITYIGTNGNNIWPTQGLHPKQAIVLHVAEGSLAACDSWFSNPAAAASASYCVGKAGEIHCYVDPASNAAPYANGLLNGEAATVKVLVAANGGKNPNYYTVSIETERVHTDPLTAAQLHAVAWLTAWECERNGIVPSEDTLLGHFEFDSVTRANCPGLDRAGWIAYEAAVAACISPAPAPSDPDLADAAIIIAAGERVRARHAAPALPAVADRFEAGAKGPP